MGLELLAESSNSRIQPSYLFFHIFSILNFINFLYDTIINVFLYSFKPIILSIVS